METWLGEEPSRPTTGLSVDVTFLELRWPPRPGNVLWPIGYHLRRWFPDVESYLALYRLVGAPHCWWMRFMMSATQLQGILDSPQTHIVRLIGPDGVVGFFEIDMRSEKEPYLSYLGLVPGAQGKGLGRSLLHSAIAHAWRNETRVLRVNTCTADHPHALLAYRSAGFAAVTVQREYWSIPDDLGLVPPKWLAVSAR